MERCVYEFEREREKEADRICESIVMDPWAMAASMQKRHIEIKIERKDTRVSMVMDTWACLTSLTCTTCTVEPTSQPNFTKVYSYTFLLRK